MKRLLLIIFTSVAAISGSQVFAQDQYVSPAGHDGAIQARQTLGQVFRAAQAKDFDAMMATAAPRYIQHSPDLPDGWKPVWDLLAKRPQGFSNNPTNWLGPKGMLDNGNYLVMLREVNRGDGTPSSKIVDIMLFDENGKYSEHWDIRQALSEKTASGRSETGAAKEFVDNPVNYDEKVEEENKKIAASFLELAFNQGEIGEALQQYVANDYVQHNPMIPDGSQPVKEMFDSGKFPPLKYDIQLILAQNDIVVVYSKVEMAGKPMAVVDMLRVRDGKLVEHWDVLQEVPPAEKMPHTNGMFLLPSAESEVANSGAIELISYKPKQGVSLEDALALDMRVKQEYVVKQPGFVSRHTGVTKDGTVYVQVLWDSIESVEASQAKGMKDELMGSYMQIMDQPSIKFHNIAVKQ